ncbi:MAG: hypothetical protein EHM20_02555 [Alphaproteobacteria bacterium]|nr:MAG: hypothetical protein EHM20_02555 [Alphaproteobacteria bacterium]
MKIQNYQKNDEHKLFYNLTILMFLLVFISVDITFGIGPCPDTPCDPPIYDGEGHFIRCGGCVLDCGVCKKCVYNGTYGFECQWKYDWPIVCCDCTSLCNYDYCKECIQLGFSWYCMNYCRTNLCEECDGHGNCPVCGDRKHDGVPELCCGGKCYDQRTQGCCGSEIYDLVTEKCCEGYGPSHKCRAREDDCCYDGSCCDKTKCMLCNSLTQKCEYRCNPLECEECDAESWSCSSKCKLDECCESGTCVEPGVCNILPKCNSSTYSCADFGESTCRALTEQINYDGHVDYRCSSSACCSESSEGFCASVYSCYYDSFDKQCEQLVHIDTIMGKTFCGDKNGSHGS